MLNSAKIMHVSMANISYVKPTSMSAGQNPGGSNQIADRKRSRP